VEKGPWLSIAERADDPQNILRAVEKAEMYLFPAGTKP